MHERDPVDRPRPPGVGLHRRRCDEAAYEKFKAQSEKKGPVGITRGLAAFIGFAEITGGLGIVLPMANNIAPVCRRKTKGPYARPGSLRRNPMNPSNS
jgi:hypothetical protein